MKRHVIALVGALAAVLAFVAGPAQAQSVQGVEQAASTGQSASSSASSTQTAPSNSNISVRIFSPGDGGSVSQSNNSAAASAAANAASTAQAVGQSQAGGGGVQAVGQAAETGQHASSSAESAQYKPTNSNISVRIHSPGDDGDVEQSNNSAAKSAAGNLADTIQEVGQEQGGGGDGKSKCCQGGGVQEVGQKAETGQKAESEATSKQFKPSNSNISVRIHSPGDDGDVSQSNNSFAGSFSGNKAKTGQGVSQEQAGGAGKCCHGAGVQAVGQQAETWQKADSDATSVQEHASNKNIPVRIGSPGENGSVTQENNSAALSFAGNAASTEQAVEQSQGGGCCGSDLVQAVGQKAGTGQWADSEATSVQKGATNSNTPVRIHSDGDDGEVEQSNNSLALSAAVNAAKTAQAVGQSQSGRCGCDGKDRSYGGAKKGESHGAGVQAVGQWAETFQKADSDATSAQIHAKNVNAPVREKSKGDGGSVSQSNNSLAASLALNLARTFQFVRQEQ